MQPPQWNDAQFGRRHALYAEEVVKKLGLKGPRIDENEIAEFRGYEIVPFDVGESLEEKKEFEGRLTGIGKSFKTACAYMFRERNLIVVNKSLSQRMQRTSAFHELGHDTCVDQQGCPIHKCYERHISVGGHAQAEQDAFSSGRAYQLPSFLFLPDMLSLPVESKSIWTLSDRWDASLEVTSKRYAEINPGLVAAIVVEPIPKTFAPGLDDEETENNQPITLFQMIPETITNSHQPWITTTYGGDRLPEPATATLQVLYTTTSVRFPKTFIPYGTKIPTKSPITDCYFTGQPWDGEIPAWHFGISVQNRSKSLRAHCFSFGEQKNKKVMVLLWLPDKQLPFPFGS